MVNKWFIMAKHVINDAYYSYGGRNPVMAVETNWLKGELIGYDTMG